ncbi:MAG: NAD(P)H-hydrate epimerase, partial [Betaproteobacteria bacterium]
MRNDFTPIFLARQIREIEQSVLGGPASPPLMLHAGIAVAKLAREMLGDRGKRVLVLAGPGNNGGDAFVAARQLKEWWFDVTVVYVGNPDKQPADAMA